MVRKSQRVWIIFVGLFIALMAALAVPKKEEREVHAADLTISNFEALKTFRNNVNNGNNYSGKTIELIADISVASSEWTGGDGTTGCIGYDSDRAFKGTFNGNGHKIMGLTIDRSGYSCEGLFGYNSGIIKNLTLDGPRLRCYDEVGGICGINAGTVDNCHIISDLRSGYIESRDNVGGICGQNSGTITNCTNSLYGNIQGRNHVSGICGRNSGTITKCTNSVLIFSTGGGVGGIAGECISGSTISYCTNTATVKTTCGGDVYAGGIAGVLSSWNIIKYCINRGEVYPTSNINDTGYNSNDCVGGITGGFYSGHTNIMVGGCANYGRIRGGNATGGIVGWDVGSSSSQVLACFNSSEVLCCETNSGQIIGSGGGITPNRCYYNSSVSATGATGTGKPGTAATPSQFASGEITYHLNDDHDYSLYGWYQNIDNDLNPHDDFPVLDSSHGTVYYGYKCKSSTQTYSNFELYSIANQPHPGYNNGFCTKCGNYQACSGSGTSDNPYTIGNAGQLYWFACVVNDVNRDRCVGNPSANNTANAKLTSDITLNSNINDANARLWKPIGRYDGTLNHSFSGTFDGNNKTISGMKVNMTSGWSNANYTYGGFFGHGSGTVKNLKITSSNVSVNCDVSTCFAGGLCGEANGTYENCDVDCSVYVNNSTETGANHGVGGMFGVLNSNGRVNNCIAKGKVETTSTNPSKNIGGFIGYLNGGNINNSSSTGTVIARHANSGNGFKVGGFAGFIEGGSVTNSGTTSSVTATDNNVSTDDYQSGTGGFAGNAKDFTLIENCYAKGNVSLTSAYKGTVAGFIGFIHNSQTNSGTTYCNVKKCYATGNVTHTTSASSGACYTGGFVGDNWNQNTGSGTTFENCYAWGNCTFNQTSSNSLTIHAGGFAANIHTPNNNTSYVRNCYAIGNVTASGSGIRYLGSLAGASSNVSFSNCYNLSSNTVSVGSGYYNGTLKNANAFSSGEVACRLNNTSGTDPVSGGTTWYQSIDNNLSPHDSYPVLNNERGIVYTGKICNSNDNFYTNDITYVDGHDFNANGFCTRCGKYQACQGSGASDDPYVVGNAGQLYWFACVVNGDSNNKCAVSPAVNTAACAKLTADITIPEKDPLNNSLLWNPIGNSSNAYSGMFDGYNNVISGMNVNISGSTNVIYGGLFGYAYNNIIQNVGVIDSSVTVGGLGSIYAGGLVGRKKGGTVRNCYVTSNVTVTMQTKAYAGGLIGELSDDSYVSDSYATGFVSSIGNSPSNSDMKAGGLIGVQYGEIEKCYALGAVTITNYTWLNAGGLVGDQKENSIIRNCYAQGPVIATGGINQNIAGGIVGYSRNNSAIYNSYAIGDVTATSSGVEYGAGRAIGYGLINISTVYTLNTSKINNTEGSNSVGSYSFEGTTKTKEEFAKGEVTYLLNNNTSGGEIWRQNLKFENSSDYDSYPVLDSTHKKVYCAYKCGMSTESYTNTNPTDSNADAWSTTPMSHVFDDNCNGFCTRCGAYQACQGSGTDEDSYKIENAGQLYWFACVVNGGDDLENKCEIPSGQSSVSRNNAACAKLTKNIVINTEEEISSNDARLWKPIGTWLEDDDVFYDSNPYPNGYKGIFDGSGYTVSGMKINITDATYNVYAAMFGCLTRATVQNVGLENCKMNIDILRHQIYGGGLVGLGYYSTINNNYVSGIIDYKCTDDMQVGGLVGSNYYGTIMNNYTNVDITGKALFHAYVGGLVGWSGSQVKNNYTIGTVSAESDIYSVNAGGITGIGSIANCYATGNINVSGSGTKYVGKLIGDEGTALNSYYADYSTITNDGTGNLTENIKGDEKNIDAFSNFEVKDLLQSYVDENSTSSNQLSSWVQAENNPEFGWNNHQLSTTISWNSLTFGYDPSTGSWATAEDDENGNKITFVNGSTGAKLRYTAEFNSPENSGITGEISHNGGNWTYEDTNTHTYPMVNSSDMTVNTNSRITTLSLSGEPNISGFDSTTESSPMEIGTITLTISG